MKADIEDPCWTAYALGELSPEEMKQAENLLSSNPELASQVETLRETLKVLQEEFSTSTIPQLEPLRRETVLQEVSPTKSSVKQIWFPAAAAAIFAIGFGIAHWRSLPQESSIVVEEDSAPMEMMMDSEEAPPSPVMIRNSTVDMFTPVTEEAPMKQRKMEPTRERSVTSASGSSLSLQEWVGDFSAGGIESKTERDELKEEALPLPTPTPTPTPEPEKVKPERGF